MRVLILTENSIWFQNQRKENQFCLNSLLGLLIFKVVDTYLKIINQ